MHSFSSIFTVLFVTACIPSTQEDLIGHSDRPVSPEGAVDSEPPDTGATNEPPFELTVDSDSIVITEIEESTELESSLVLSVDDSRILHVEHTFEWDSNTISTVQVTQTDDYALDFDYGSSGETYIWLTIQYSFDVSSLETGTYSVTAEGNVDEFVLE